MALDKLSQYLVHPLSPTSLARFSAPQLPPPPPFSPSAYPQNTWLIVKRCRLQILTIRIGALLCTDELGMNKQASRGAEREHSVQTGCSG